MTNFLLDFYFVGYLYVVFRKLLENALFCLKRKGKKMERSQKQLNASK